MRLLLALAVVLALRAPFLDQAIHGDDVYYLAAAEHAQIEPLHPLNFRYVFLGDAVDMEGHTHPPLNAWFLGLLLAMFGDIREAGFHAAYLLFSLIAAASMWSLARRYSPHPMWATLLFLATPAFVINGNTLEADVPFAALWLAGAALFAARRYGPAAVALALASMTAYQAALLTPVLAVHALLFDRRSRAAWAACLIPPLTIAGWQIFELATIGRLPLAVLAAHFESYQFQSAANKLRNAAALPVHFLWLVFPALIPAAILASRKRRDRETIFLASWIAIFFAAGIGIFFAGSARYLLPVAGPVALLVSRLDPRWLGAGFALHLPVSLLLAAVNYQHAEGYRDFAASLAPQFENKRVWINGEWGLRFYLESAGGVPLRKGQSVPPGDMVVSSRLAYPAPFTSGGGALTPVAAREIRPGLPLRLIALETRSAYSTVDRGYLPFDISGAPIDIVRAEAVIEREPILSYLPMSAPEAAHQIVSGAYQLEGAQRWSAKEAVILLKSPERGGRVRVVFFTPFPRRVTLKLDGVEIGAQNFTPGLHTIEALAPRPAKASATLAIAVDRTTVAPGDLRELGVKLTAAGFVP